MLKGNFNELGDFMRRLQKLPDANREIAIQLAPKVAALVDETFSAQASPDGDAWPATKSGAPAFGGGGSLGHVLSRLVGKATIRTTVLYPLHFHQDGTHRVGRKRGREIARKILGSAAAAERKRFGSLPRKRKGESEEEYERRVEFESAKRSAVKEAREMAKGRARMAVEEARAAGGWHDPPRPMIPAEDAAIPDRWMTEIRDTAREVMAQYGAEERG